VRTVRDPLWHNVRLEPLAAEVVDTPQFQRLRRVKQLGFGHFVYPGAVHTRFLHALGVYHLCRRAIDMLREAGDLEALDDAERAELPLVRLAALLHDVGHYAFSHAMEEVEKGWIPGEHEELAGRFLEAPPIRRALERVHPDGPARVAAFIRGESGHPLQGLVAGSLDLDKIDYLRRDAFFCGVPYGTVDVDRLVDSLTLARPEPGAPAEVAVTEKGSAALESLLFSKYQMFRNVYWHHAVRAATVCFRRLVEGALREGVLERDELPGRTDEELLGLLGSRAAEGGAERVSRRVDALVNRRLPKRCIELHGHQLPDGVAAWLGTHPDLVRRLERRLAREWGRPEGSVYVDYPAYPRMLELGVLLVRRDGRVQRLTSSGEKGLIDLPRLGRSLHHAARVFRVFTERRLPARDPGPLLELLEAGADEVEARLSDSEPLY
jgi:HD superfamily phosphohydrolase